MYTMGTQAELSSLLQGLATTASGDYIQNGAIVHHVVCSNPESKFRKKDFKQTSDAIHLLLGNNSPDLSPIKLKVKDTYNINKYPN